MRERWNMGDDDRRRSERRAERQRQALGYAVTPESMELEREVDRLLANANGRRSPQTTLTADHVRLAMAAVAWGASRWAYVENDFTYPKPSTMAFVARGPDGRVGLRIVDVAKRRGPDAIFGYGWVYHAVDKKLRSVDPSTFRWFALTMDHVPSEAELNKDDEDYLRVYRTRGSAFRSNFSAAEGLVRSGASWSLEAARAFSAAASEPPPGALADAWAGASILVRDALASDPVRLRDFIAFPFDLVMSQAGDSLTRRLEGDLLRGEFLHWWLRCAMPSRLAESQIILASRMSAAAKKQVVLRAFEAAKRYADSVAPLDCSAPVPLAMQEVRDWTCRTAAPPSRNPGDRLDRLRRRAEAGDPEAMRRYRSEILTSVASAPPWEDREFSETFHQVLEDLRPGSSSKKDVGGWGEVIPDIRSYARRANGPQPWGDELVLVGGASFANFPSARRQFAWLSGRQPLAGRRRLVVVAYALGWKPRSTTPVRGVAMSLASYAEAAELEALVKESGGHWINGMIRTEGPPDRWNRLPLVADSDDGEPIHASGRRPPGSGRAG